MKFFKASLFAAAAALAMLASGAADAQTEVKIGYALAENSHYGVAAKAWAESVEQATNGTLKFRQFPSSALGGERETVEGLQLGTIEAVIVSTGTLSNFVPAVGVTDIPFLFRDLKHARDVLDGPIGQEILTQFDERGMVALAWGEQGFRHITNNRHPINTPADLAGLKLRTMENPVHITAFTTLGAAPTPMAWPEVIGALQQGTIDGQENPMSVIVSAKLPQLQKYLSLTSHVYGPALVLMSPSAYEGLSDADKAAFKAAGIDAAKAMRAYVDNVEQKGLEAVKSQGMQVNTVDHAAFVEALKPVYPQYHKQFGKELVESIQNTK